jgi:AraC-like DNA-binding protein
MAGRYDIGALSAVMFVQVRGQPGRISLPDVCCDLLWVDERLWLTGPQSRAQPTTAADRIFQIVNIDPLVARTWLGVPLHELTDRRIPLDEIGARFAGPLCEMFHAGGASALVRPADHFSTRLMDARMVAAEAVLRRGASVQAAATAAELSERQLGRQFEDWFGLTPKQYARILRLRHAIHSAKSGKSFVAAALSAGYSDQAHFNRDVRALAETSPRALLPRVGNIQDVSDRLRNY